MAKKASNMTTVEVSENGTSNSEFTPQMMQGFQELLAGLARVSEDKGDKKKTRRIRHRNVQIERHEDATIVLPENMSYDESIRWIQDIAADEERVHQVRHSIPGHPMDVAVSFAAVLQETFGFYKMQGWQSFFGEIPPALQTIRTGPGVDDRTEVPWGRITVPGMDPKIDIIEIVPEINNDAIPGLMIGGRVRKKFVDLVALIAKLTEEHLARNSIYRGRAVRVSFDWISNRRRFDPDGDQPEFLQLSERKLIFNREVEDALRAELYGRILYAEQGEASDIRTRSGILLAGPYGTGKTETALNFAQIAADHNWIFFYLENPRDLPHALRLARVYANEHQGVVVFCEDVDSVTSGGRTALVNDISLAMDGIESKDASSRVITVLTTNHADRIDPVLKRPGRLDAIINMGVLNGEATARFFEAFCVDAEGNSLLVEDADLSQVVQWVDSLKEGGFTPVFLHSIVQRAKKINLANNQGRMGRLTVEQLLSAAESYLDQYRDLTAGPDQERGVGEAFIDEIVERIKDHIDDEATDELVYRIRDEVRDLL